jgi:membrane protein involved in colicin uptake
MFRLFMLIVVLGVAIAPARAQTPASTYTDLQAGLEAAQAAANRPGDAALGCDALEKELVASVKDPAVESHVAKSGAAAKQQMAAMNAAKGRAATQTALTLFGSLVPGGAGAGLAGTAALGQAQQVEAAQNIQQRMQQAQEMIGIMPAIMRGQRVIELAQARNCDWLAGSLPR